MIKIVILALLLAPLPAVCAMPAEDGTMGLTAHNIFDNRTSLGLSAKIKHRQLVNRRAQMAATQTIIGLLAGEKFEKASKIARAKLGLTDEMKQIYDLSKNDDFKTLGLAFHNSADELAVTLQTKDMKKSLQALGNTTKYCVQCHNRFRQ
jgi:cytochrome c556